MMSRQSVKGALLATVAVGFAISANPAIAQDAQAASAQDAQAGGLDTIVVTAQRREENVQRSSLSIDVLGGDELVDAGVSTAFDLNTQVPGLAIAGGNTAQTFIRGVGDFGSTALGQSAVAYNLDGIYLADQTAVFNHFYDLQRVEVLKGPQGTLYGRNSSAGAINIIPAKPKLNGLSGDFLAEYGNFDSLRLSGGANVPLGEHVAARAAFNIVDRDGYLADGTNDDVQQAGRLQLLIEPSSDLTILLGGDLEHRGGRGVGSDPFPRVAGEGKFTGAIDAASVNQLKANAVVPAFLLFAPGAGLPPATTLRPGLGPVAVNSLLRDTYVDHDQFGFFADISYNLGEQLTVTLLPGYRESHGLTGSYVPGLPFLTDERSKQFSTELRLAYDSDLGNVIVGAYYMDLNQQSDFRSYVLTVNQTVGDSDISSDNYAVFGQGSFNLTDDLRLILGGRYSWEKRGIDGQRTPLGLAPIPFSGDVTFENFSYRAGLEYDVSPDSMIYATTSKGFKSGGFNTFAPTATRNNVYDPEVLYSYTLGMRNRFADNKVQLNVEAFYWDYRNGHTTQFGFDPAGDLQFLTFNAGSSKIYGFDLDAAVRLVEGGTLSAKVAYLHASYDEFVFSIPTSRYNPTAVGCPATSAGGFTSIDCSGRTMPRSPAWSGSVDYDQEVSLSNGATVTIGGGITFATARELSTDYIAVSRAKGYVLGDAYAAYTFPGDHVTLTAFINNIGNTEYQVGGILHPFAPALLYPNVGAPRTYGMRLTANF